MSIGALIALIVGICALVLFLTARMDGIEAAMFGGLAVAILLAGFPIPWRPAP
jgi:anaerobic C4-dicarboxylate transporter